MRNKSLFISSLCRGLIRKGVHAVFGSKSTQVMPKSYYGEHILSPLETNDYILRCLLSPGPCLISRFGSNELKVLRESFEVNFNLRRKIPQKDIDSLANFAGMFSKSEEGVATFVKMTLDAAKRISGLCCWGNVCEDYVWKTECPNSQLLDLDGLESYLFEKPWTSALKGKKVLVVHPFSDSIQKQYKIREKLFSNKDVLPEFQLFTVKAPQTIMGTPSPYSSWKEALIETYLKCRDCDYDVAIVGCGAYGMVLASMLAEDGKKVIHSGGVTQIYFGIKGERWEKREYMKKIINENWINPSKAETPNKFSSVEGGCYW